MGYSFIHHKGRKILYIDYTQCKSLDEMLTVLDSVRELYEKSNESFYVINDFTGAYGSSEFLNKAKELGAKLFSKKTKKSAILGVTGIKKILVQAYNMVVKHKIVLCDSKLEALDYLASN